MANPFVLFENVFADTAGTLSQTIGTAATGFPVTNVIDWRIATAFRWKAANTTVDDHIRMDLGDGVTATPDTVCIGGHNLATAGATWDIQHSTDGAAWVSAFSAVTPPDDLPAVKTFTGAARRYWKLRILGSVFSVAPQLGILTLGRRIDFEGGATPALDAYGSSVVADGAINENGTPIGISVRNEIRQFRIDYGTGQDPGFTKTGFFAPASGLTWDGDWKTHALINGKPFWFVWNIDEDANGVYLCQTLEQANPFVTSTARRGLQTTFTAYREVS